MAKKQKTTVASAMTPDLRSYAIILINTSGGKDSQAMLHYIVQLAIAQGVLDRVRVVHADLGVRVEWAGTIEIVKAQAAHYGLEVIITKRTQNDLLDHAVARGMWPSAAQRWCTSDHKRGPVQRVIVALGRENKPADGSPVRVLNCMGIRAQESVARAKKTPFQVNKRASCQSRHVDDWFPIFDWTELKVWAEIDKAGTPHHHAYDLGMSRLSCAFCILASEKDLCISAKANPELLATYVAVEKQIGHTFKNGWSLADLQDRIERGVA